MNVAMIKHNSWGKVYWFEIPEHLSREVKIGMHVACSTKHGKKYGIVTGIATIDTDDIKATMEHLGATFPLRQITDVTCDIPIDSIKIPEYMKRTKPRDELIAKRFLEYYHTMQFNTRVEISESGELKDGYSAYLVAKILNLPYISGIANPQSISENVSF